MSHEGDAALDDLNALRRENERLRAIERELGTAIESLRASEDRLRLAVEAAHIGVWEWDVTTNRVTWDAKKHDVFGLAQGSFAGTREAFFDLVHPDDRAGLQTALTRALERNAPYRNEFRIIGASSHTRWISNLAHVFRDDAGRPLRMLGVVQDITERHAIERTLRDSEEKFRSFVETTSEWIWEVDALGRLTYSNPVVQHVLGYRPDELRGKLLVDFVHEEDQPIVQRVLADAIVEKRGWTGLSVRCQHRDKSYRHLECHGRPVVDDNGQLIGFRGSDRDVTDRLESEEMRRDAHRMEGVARLAGGFAHHFNNLLTVIAGRADLASEGADAGRIGGDLQAIRQAAQRGALLTKQLLTFAGRQVVRPRFVDLNAHISQLRDTLTRLLGHDIVLTLRLDFRLWTVSVDPAQLDIVLTNLVANAQDAMPNGGVLTIATSNVTSSDPDALREPEVVPGDYVLVSVTDTGTGMTEDIAQKMFEPFFSTKELGADMVGLGLSTCYGIVAQQGGHIRVQTEPNVGSTLRVFLRRASTSIVTETGGAEAVFSARDTATVLVVDDEPAVCLLVAKILRTKGYTVLQAHSGRDALAIAHNWQGTIHALLTDVVMAGMNGVELAAHLTTDRPGIRVVFMSGYGGDKAVTHLRPPGRHFVAKPFMANELVTVMRAVLQERPNA